MKAAKKREQRKERAEPSADAGWLCDQLIKLNGEPGGPLGGWPDHIAFGATGKGAGSGKSSAGNRSYILQHRGPDMLVPKSVPSLRD